MRKLIVLTFVSLDGVMQAPGGPDEDRDGGFMYGGWTVPHFDDVGGQEMGRQMTPPFDLLLGRKTYDIFASYWPHHPEDGASLNAAHKYVASRSGTSLPWGPATKLEGDVVEAVRRLKTTDGPDLQVHGSSDLLQTLVESDLVDQYWLKYFPVVLGEGKRLFSSNAFPQTYTLTRSLTTPSGVLIGCYKRDGEIRTGSF